MNRLSIPTAGWMHPTLLWVARSYGRSTPIPPAEKRVADIYFHNDTLWDALVQRSAAEAALRIIIGSPCAGRQPR
ncbi:hypothetical protein Tco_0477187 [Tanacetum coccineum]